MVLPQGVHDDRGPVGRGINAQQVHHLGQQLGDRRGQVVVPRSVRTVGGQHDRLGQEDRARRNGRQR